MRSILFAAAFGVSLPASAWANPFDLFGAGARAQAMGGAVAALSSDYMATFHNPAGLPYGRNEIGLGIVGSFNRTSILLSPRPSGYDPPAYGQRLNARADTEDPDGVLGATVGLTLKLFDEDVAIGAAFFVPFDGFARMRTSFPDEQEQYFTNRLRFELVGDRAGGEVIALGLGYRLLPWFSMGMGLMVVPAARTINNVYTPNSTDPSSSLINVDIEQSARAALTAGLRVDPYDWLRIGAAFQDELFVGLEGYNQVQLRGDEDAEPILQPLDVVRQYSPPRLSGSVALVAPSGLTGTVEGTWLGWSNYLNARAELAGFDDTFDWKLGVEYPVNPRTYFRGGLGWSPSPVPPQTGRTNYVDNDRVVLGLGAGRDFEVWGEQLTVDLAIQLHALLVEETRKTVRPDGAYPPCGEGVTGLCDEVPDLAQDTPLQRAADTKGLQTGNPGFPGYTHGGYIMAASIDVKWRF
jgi:long-chain fatty acid transport protein